MFVVEAEQARERVITDLWQPRRSTAGCLWVMWTGPSYRVQRGQSSWPGSARRCRRGDRPRRRRPWDVFATCNKTVRRAI